MQIIILCGVIAVLYLLWPRAQSTTGYSDLARILAERNINIDASDRQIGEKLTTANLRSSEDVPSDWIVNDAFQGSLADWYRFLYKIHGLRIWSEDGDLIPIEDKVTPAYKLL